MSKSKGRKEERERDEEEEGEENESVIQNHLFRERAINCSAFFLLGKSCRQIRRKRKIFYYKKDIVLIKYAS